MLSSIASFLPSSLHIGQNDPQQPPRFSQDDPASEDEHDDIQASLAKQQVDHSHSPAKARDKPVNESFIIVRPPPSKSNHPLNLQVQLVPPNTKPPNGVVSQSTTSVSTDRTESENTLARTVSNRSNVSYSNYGSSTSSFTSVASSSTSTRRTIVPLYNLQAHNVMTNIIVDAGTDAKIAKFQKRGIILIDLVSLEPVEVWGDLAPNNRASMNLTVDEQQATSTRNSAFSIRSNATSSRAHSPELHLPTASSAISLNSTKQHPQYQNPVQPPSHLQHHSSHSPLPSVPDSVTTPSLSGAHLSPPSLPPKRNILGRLFQGSPNKKVATPSASPSLVVTSDSSQATPKASFQRNSELGTPTPNGNGTTQRGHTKNISITAFTSPIKSPFKHSKKLSSLVGGSSSSSLNNNNAAHLDGQVTGVGFGGKGDKGVPSPNMSASSLTMTTESTESGGVVYNPNTIGGGAANPPMLGSSHLHPTHAQPPNPGLVPSSSGASQAQSQARLPVLGIQPTYVSALGSSLTSPSDRKARALMYVWLARKWLKRPSAQDELHSFSAAGGLGGGGFLGLGPRGKDNGIPTEPGAGVEVRFEWKRAKAKARGRGGREKSEGEGGRKRRKSNGNAAVDLGDGEQEEGQIGKEGGTKRRGGSRLSTVSVRSTRSFGSGIGETASDVGREERSSGEKKRRPRTSQASGVESMASEGMFGERDLGEESDPEDSETPWVCTLKVRRTTPGTNNGNGGPHATSPSQSHKTSGGGPEVLKVKLATLSPTPHHPKVVAMFKVPFPLLDIEVERLGVRRRPHMGIPGQGIVDEFGEVGQRAVITGEYPGGPHGGDGEYRGLVLTAEELKDIVCSTAFWLVVREGIGGVGRVNRKGDGWRIRQ